MEKRAGTKADSVIAVAPMPRKMDVGVRVHDHEDCREHNEDNAGGDITARTRQMLFRSMEQPRREQRRQDRDREYVSNRSCGACVLLNGADRAEAQNDAGENEEHRVDPIVV